MNLIRFAKYEALGNDFILIDESQDKKRNLEPSTSVSLRRALCERKSGIGADGVITLLPPTRPEALVFMHLTNADGSIAENCGNGLRCVAQWLLDHEHVEHNQDFKIDTLSGLKKAKIADGLITVELGVSKVAIDVDQTEISKTIASFASTYEVQAPEVLAYVTIGNPHLIVETNDIDLAQKHLGPLLEKLSLFQGGVNVNFVKRLEPNSVALRVWERGAGATDACGSGAGATVSALVLRGALNPNSAIAVQFKNGVLSVTARPHSDDEVAVEICGNAHKCFEGIWEGAESIC